MEFTQKNSQPWQQKCGPFGSNKEKPVPIGLLEEIYEYTEAIRDSIKSYL